MESFSNGELSNTHASVFRQSVRYILHLIAVYIIVNTTPMWLAGFFHARFLPLVQQHDSTISSFQFAFSHLFMFSFWPAVIVGFVYSQWFRHRVTFFVWIVPVVVLTYKFLTFPAATVFQSHFDVTFHQYFGGGFIIPEWSSYEELFKIAGSNPDMPRGMEQLRYTAPVYAAVGYALGSVLAMRFRVEALVRLRPTACSGSVT